MELAGLFVTGATVTYSAGRILGYTPGWFGPESAAWNVVEWNKNALEHIKQIESDPTFIRTTCIERKKNPRKVMRVGYYSSVQRVLKGVVKFGSDCEGPPRCCHGGCSASTANLFAIDFVRHFMPTKAFSQPSTLQIDYFMKIPLGLQLGVECVLIEEDLNRLVVEVSFFSLRERNVYIKSKVTFTSMDMNTSHL
jgi:hypothetical protein